MKKLSVTNLSLEMLAINSFALLMLMLSIPGYAGIIYSQAFIGTSTNNSYVTSAINGTDLDQWTYNAFTPTHSGTVSSINWQGQIQPTASIFDNTNEFVIKVYESPNNPNTLNINTKVIASITIPGNAGQTSIANGLYNFNVNAFTPFAITAGTQYWMNIYASDGMAYANWGWANGSGGTGITQDRVSGRAPGQWQDVQAGARAFSLNGTLIASVPEPATLVLFCAGLVGLGVFGKRRNS